MTATPPTQAPGAVLLRVSPHYLQILGLRCGLSCKPWSPDGTPCGGELWVQDWHPKGQRGQWRYEVYCRKCSACDPNGHPRQDMLIPSALEYFHAFPVDAAQPEAAAA